MGRHKDHGFTIVELLIVIVVIAILAAITIVAFNGIQQRAKNTAKISTVASIAKLISLYRTENNNAYPVTTSGNWCLTVDNQCRNYDGSTISSSNSTLLSSLNVNGNVPASSNDTITGTYYGITYMYSTARTLNSVPNPFILLFWLDGTNQSCTGVAGMVSVGDSGVSNDMTQKTQAKADTGTNQTRCYLMFAS